MISMFRVGAQPPGCLIVFTLVFENLKKGERKESAWMGVRGQGSRREGIWEGGQVGQESEQQ